MDKSSELIQALRPVLVELDRLGVRYCIGGSVASSCHGAARSTLDVDLAAELDEAAAQEMISALRDAYYVSESAVREAVQRKSCFNLLHLATSFKVDVFVSRDREFDRSVQDRASAVMLGETEPIAARVVSAEDIILTKLEWYRLGNCVSERQWNDVTQVAKLYGPRLDRDYLRHWAGVLGLTDLLERLLSEVGRATETE